MPDKLNHAMSPALVESGDIYVEVYPMRILDDKDVGARLIEAGEEPDFYDVMLRPDDWEANNGVPYDEWEDLTKEDAEKVVAELEVLNPGIAVNWVSP